MEIKGIDVSAYQGKIDWEMVADYGMGFAILINFQTGINAEVVLGGMISGLASTGLYEMLRNLLDKDGKKEN